MPIACPQAQVGDERDSEQADACADQERNGNAGDEAERKQSKEGGDAACDERNSNAQVGRGVLLQPGS
jgi:hypothetical protein